MTRWMKTNGKCHWSNCHQMHLGSKHWDHNALICSDKVVFNSGKSMVTIAYDYSNSSGVLWCSSWIPPITTQWRTERNPEIPQHPVGIILTQSSKATGFYLKTLWPWQRCTKLHKPSMSMWLALWDFSKHSELELCIAGSDCQGFTLPSKPGPVDRSDLQGTKTALRTASIAGKRVQDLSSASTKLL